MGKVYVPLTNFEKTARKRPPFLEQNHFVLKNLNVKPNTVFPEGAGGTEGTKYAGEASSGSPKNKREGTGGTFNPDEACNPLHDADENQLKIIKFDDLKMPCFIVESDWFTLGGKRKPGVYYCYETAGTAKKPPAQIVQRVCSPLYVDGVTNTEDRRFYGRLLRFRDTLGRWREWAMPMELLRGSCEELRGELLAAGVEIETRHRAKIPEYLQSKIPKKIITAAIKTGWTAEGKAFVLHDRIIGSENVHFQSETLSSEGAAKSGGDYRQWQKMAGFCVGNPVLMVSVCVNLAGALLVKVHRDSGGIHWQGDSSTGKTTGLLMGVSVWGGGDFKRDWRATSNGLEGVAALLSDTCLNLDEINEADPREVGAIIYMLGNGTGKTRADRFGAARNAPRWRLTVVSTGERSVGARMQEAGKQIKAGQEVRLLNVPSTRKHGVFDELHCFQDGREMADYFKTESAKHFGHAGVKFVEHIIKEVEAKKDFCSVLAAIEAQFPHKDNQAARAASRFAVYAMAGEMAIEAEILPWALGSALDACKIMFSEWQSMRGKGATEHRQILQNVADYILKFGDTKFTDKSEYKLPKTERAGWFTDRTEGRVYLFSPAALREAGGNYDFTRVLVALNAADWIIEKEEGKHSKKTAITGIGKPRSLSDNRYECLIFCGAIMQKKQDWACKTISQITHS